VSSLPRPLLLVGGSGMLGRAVRAEAERRGVSPLCPPRSELDLEAPEAARAAVQKLAPAVVVNVAAWTDVAGAERPELRERVFRINRDGPWALAEACRSVGALFVQMSTDYVFDGAKRTPYAEEDRPNPLQVYGRSKLEGERAALAAHPDTLVVRSSTLYGPGRQGRPHYVEAILAQAARTSRIEVVETPVSSPTYTVDLAAAILDLIERAPAGGILHAVNEGASSRLELARATIEEAGLAGEVEVSGRPDPGGGVLRPSYSVLATSKLEKLLGRRLRPWREALRDYLRAHRCERLP